MVGKLAVFFALLAVASAGNVIIPETRIDSVPVLTTKIQGPSGEITQEQSLSLISQEEKVVEAPVVPLVQPAQVVTLQPGYVPVDNVVQQIVPVQNLVQPEVFTQAGVRYLPPQSFLYKTIPSNSFVTPTGYLGNNVVYYK